MTTTHRRKGHRKERTCYECGKLIVPGSEYHDESTFKGERYYHPDCCPVCQDADLEDDWEAADIAYDRERNT